MEPSEREWLRSQLAELADGNRDAFGSVYERVWPLVRGFVRRQLASGEAEDVAQEALLRVFARAGEYDRSRDALGWILGIAAWEIRTVKTRLRRRREEALADVAEQPGGEATPEEVAIGREREQTVERALAALDPMDAATLNAYMRDDRPDVPPATFRKRVQRALGRARAAWPRGGNRE